MDNYVASAEVYLIIRAVDCCHATTKLTLSLETELFTLKPELPPNPWLQDSEPRLAFGSTKWRLLSVAFSAHPSMMTGQSALSGRKRASALHRAFGTLFYWTSRTNLHGYANKIVVGS